jgi:thioredoxin reductase
MYMKATYEIIIVGGGPAGLSAALIAGRARRKVLLIDGGIPRNSAAPAIHSYLTQDGILPGDFRAICHRELEAYSTVDRLDGMVADIRRNADWLEVDLSEGTTVSAENVILALGLIDTLPDITDLASYWGRGIHACPFCDGYEHRDGAWGILADSPAVLDHVLFFRAWTSNITVFAQADGLPLDKIAALEQAGIAVEKKPIKRVIGRSGILHGVELEDASVQRLDSLWIRPAQTQTMLVSGLGLTLREDGAICRDELGATSIEGIFAAGDCAAGPMQQAILAAADSAKVAFAVVRRLMMSH